MKKKVTRPDGTVVEYEGTVEELAQLESEESGDDKKHESKKKGRRILNEKRVARMIRKALRRHAEEEHNQLHWPPYQPIQIQPTPIQIDRDGVEDWEPYRVTWGPHGTGYGSITGLSVETHTEVDEGQLASGDTISIPSVYKA